MLDPDLYSIQQLSSFCQLNLPNRRWCQGSAELEADAAKEATQSCTSRRTHRSNFSNRIFLPRIAVFSRRDFAGETLRIFYPPLSQRATVHMQVSIEIISRQGRQIWGMEMERSPDASGPQLLALLLGSHIRNPRTGVIRRANGDLQIRLRVRDESVSVQVVTFSSNLKLNLGTTLDTSLHKAAVAVFINAGNVSLAVHQQPKPKLG